MFKNTEKFEKWLKDTLKPEYANGVNFTFDEWLFDVERQYDETGFCGYELSPFETKSGYPECISFSVKAEETEDDCFETTYIF